MIFCLPENCQRCVDYSALRLTVTAWLDRGLNVANALDCDTVLVVSVDELVLKLTNLVDEYTKLVCDIGDVIITSLAPDAELLLRPTLEMNDDLAC